MFSRISLAAGAAAGGLVVFLAMQAVNAIPALCDAPPGIRTMADLPLIRSGVGFGFA